ncbi:MAG: two-component sensor histidine kinase [Burkholderiales bacterium PBB3]|nr:MAG: two-component sensor histidine kinase [Burkholderiales bacterium PBB3]
MNTPESPATAQGADRSASAVRIADLEAQVLALQAEMQSLTATISHDLRAPLRHITSFAQLVQDEAGPQLNEEMREFLGNISGAAKTLGSMLDGLLALSSVGTVALHPEPLDWAALVQALVLERQRALQGQAPGRVVLWSVDDAALPAVQADAKLLRQALGHVLDNAVKFTGPQLQAHIRVSASIDATTGQLHCVVQDNGVGFAPEQAAQLFKPFVRLHASSQFAGLGMGLALVRKSLQRMGGDARISATVQGGCQVVLLLPLA